MPKVVHWRESDGSTAQIEQGPLSKFSRVFYATVDNVDVDPFYILTYKKCPKLGEVHKHHDGALVVRVKATQIGSSKIYKVMVEWSTAATDEDNDPDPLKRAAKISIVSRLEEYETFRDGDGNILVNTAGDIIVVNTFKTIQRITIQKNVAKVPDWFHTFPGSVNEFPVKIEDKTYAARTLLMGESERPHRTLEGKTWYYPITFQLDHNEETWDTFQPSTGYHELVPILTDNQIAVQTALGLTPKPVYTKKRITGPPGDYPNEPQYLDKYGAHINLEQGKKRGQLDTSNIFIQRFNRFKKNDLNKLPRK